MSQFITPSLVRGMSTYYGIGFQVSFDEKNRPFALLTNVTNPGVEKELHEVINQLIEASINFLE